MWYLEIAFYFPNTVPDFSTYLLVLLTLLLEVENTHKEKLILVDLKLVLFPFVEESHFNHVSQVPYIVWCFILVWPFVLELLSPTGWQNTVFPEVNTPQRERGGEQPVPKQRSNIHYVFYFSETLTICQDRQGLIVHGAVSKLFSIPLDGLSCVIMLSFWQYSAAWQWQAIHNLWKKQTTGFSTDNWICWPIKVYRSAVRCAD